MSVTLLNTANTGGYNLSAGYVYGVKVTFNKPVVVSALSAQVYGSTGAFTPQIYETTNDKLIASGSSTPVTGSGIMSFPLSSPIVLQPNVTYMLALYGNTTGQVDGASSASNITITDSNTGITMTQTNIQYYASSNAYPATTNQSSYGMDLGVVVDPFTGIAVDSSAWSGPNQTSAINITTTQNNEMILVFIQQYNASPGNVAVSFDGVSNGQYQGGTTIGTNHIDVYSYVAPTAGTHTVKVVGAVTTNGFSILSLLNSQGALIDTHMTGSMPVSLPSSGSKTYPAGTLYLLFEGEYGSGYTPSSTWNSPLSVVYNNENQYSGYVTQATSAGSSNSALSNPSLSGSSISGTSQVFVGVAVYINPPSTPTWTTQPNANSNEAVGATINLAWGASTPGVGGDSLTYTLQQSISGGSWSNVATGLTSTSYTYTVPNNVGSTLQFQVVANESNGQTSTSVVSNSVNIVADPSAPSAANGNPTTLNPSGSNTFYWNAVTPTVAGDTVTYKLEYQDVTASGAWTNITTGITTTTYNWTPSPSLTAGHNYSVRVSAYEDGAYGTPTTLVSNATAGSPPTAPTSFNATVVSGTEIKFSWGGATSYNSDPMSYALAYQKQGTANWTAISSAISGTSYDWSSFALPSGYYNFQVTPTDTTLNLAGSSATISNVYIPQGGVSMIRGASNVNLVNVLMVSQTIPTVVPHVTIYAGLCVDKTTNEVLMFVATHYSSDSAQSVDFTNADGMLAFDTFHLQGRPLLKDYAGVTM